MTNNSAQDYRVDHAHCSSQATPQQGGEDFYTQLPPFSDFAAATQIDHHRSVPGDWLVVVADVRGSTQAIEEGRYKDVNALGVATIVAVLNAVTPLRIPYVFGGDGATFIIPPGRRQAVAEALVAARTMGRSAFALDLRVGMVPMQTLQAAQHQVLVAVYQPSPHYRQAMFLGDGLRHAESLIKDPATDNPYLIPDDGSIAARGDFSGFECRWNEIASPHEETISLLVQARGQNFAAQDTVYRHVLHEIRTIYGDDEHCHPLRRELLTLSSSPRTLATEVRVLTTLRSRWRGWAHAVILPVITAIGRFVMGRGIRTGAVDWGTYKDALIANTDHRKFDEVLRMVISGTAEQRQRLRRALEQRRQAGDLVFGIHAAATALMTCVISDYANEHVHFLDASHGGYALAAKEMKAQLAAG